MVGLLGWCQNFTIIVIDFVYYDKIPLNFLIHITLKFYVQWRNDALGAQATPGGDLIGGGARNHDKDVGNFARLIAHPAKVGFLV